LIFSTTFSFLLQKFFLQIIDKKFKESSNICSQYFPLNQKHHPKATERGCDENSCRNWFKHKISLRMNPGDLSRGGI